MGAGRRSKSERKEGMRFSWVLDVEGWMDLSINLAVRGEEGREGGQTYDP
jgi:hypothetical protein